MIKLFSDILLQITQTFAAFTPRAAPTSAPVLSHARTVNTRVVVSVMSEENDCVIISKIQKFG